MSRLKGAARQALIDANKAKYDAMIAQHLSECGATCITETGEVLTPEKMVGWLSPKHWRALRDQLKRKRKPKVVPESPEVVAAREAEKAKREAVFQALLNDGPLPEGAFPKPGPMPSARRTTWRQLKEDERLERRGK